MTKKPLNTCIFCPPGHGYIFTSYFFEKKIKETPNSKVKILCPKWQIRIYIVAKKKTDHTILSPIILSMPSASY